MAMILTKDWFRWMIEKRVRWILDPLGNIGLEICGRVTIIKQGKFSLIRFGKTYYETAPDRMHALRLVEPRPSASGY